MNSRLRRSAAARAGFSFLEIMLVVAIIGILVSVIGPRLVGGTAKAKKQATNAQMAGLKTALGQYEMDAGQFPSTSEGLQALVTRPASFPENEWPAKGYLASNAVPKDSWGTDFQYACPSEHGGDFDLSSAGPDRQHGTADDLANWVEGANDAGKGGGKL